MFENELQTRCAICGTGILLGLIFVLAHLPLILLIGAGRGAVPRYRCGPGRDACGVVRDAEHARHL